MNFWSAQIELAASSPFEPARLSFDLSLSTTQAAAAASMPAICRNNIAHGAEQSTSVAPCHRSRRLIIRGSMYFF